LCTRKDQERKSLGYFVSFLAVRGLIPKARDILDKELPWDPHSNHPDKLFMLHFLQADKIQAWFNWLVLCL